MQTVIAIITEDKVTELFCIAEGFCNFLEAFYGYVSFQN